MDTITECNQKYADAFARLREKHGVTIQDVARRSKIPLSTLKRTLQGTTGTPMATYEILVTKGLGATMHEFVDEIYGAVPQAEEPTQRYTAAVRLLLAEKDRRIQHLGKWLRWAVVYSVSVIRNIDRAVFVRCVKPRRGMAQAARRSRAEHERLDFIKRQEETT